MARARLQIGMGEERGEGVVRMEDGTANLSPAVELMHVKRSFSRTRIFFFFLTVLLLDGRSPALQFLRQRLRLQQPSRRRWRGRRRRLRIPATPPSPQPPPLPAAALPPPPPAAAPSVGRPHFRRRATDRRHGPHDGRSRRRSYAELLPRPVLRRAAPLPPPPPTPPPPPPSCGPQILLSTGLLV